MGKLPGVDDIRTETAEDFLEALSPRKFFDQHDRGGWIYRGQANAGWELKASANRATMDKWREFEFLAHILNGGDKNDWRLRYGLVAATLEHFVAGLDVVGLTVPSERYQGAFFASGHFDGKLPRDTEWPLMALAQHHNLPTFFLDWTRRAPVAAYFAAYFACEPSTMDHGTHLAVWAAHQWSNDVASPLNASNSKRYLQFYSPPASTNPNLRAQSGLFTINFSEDEAPLEDYFAEMCTITGRSHMRRITLPHSEAGKVMRMLANEDVTGAFLFPGTDGVVRAMREQRFWNRLPPKDSL